MVSRGYSKGSMVAAFLIGIFVISIAFAIFAYRNSQSVYYRETQAVITFIDTHVEEFYDHENGEYYSEVSHDVYVEYEVNGEFYSDILIPDYDITMYVGKTITITYDMRDPSIVVINDSTMIIILSCMVGVGVLLIIAGFVILVKRKKGLVQDCPASHPANNVSNSDWNSNNY